MAAWLFQQLQLMPILEFYQQQLHPWVIITEVWFIAFLIIELLLRWIIAVVKHQHSRWFFFPFIHWYEVLAIIPYLRFLRLLRAGIIAYRLYEMGYNVIPENWSKQAIFYYRVVMEELSDRVVLTVIHGIKQDLKTSSAHKRIIHELVDHHRQLFAVTLAELLQENLATQLKLQQRNIASHVGHIVSQAVEDTPELTQLLRLMPIVGSRIEQQLQSIGQRLGENITQGLIEPFSQTNRDMNKTYADIAKHVSEVDIQNKQLESLVESVVTESLEAIRAHVKVKRWKQILNEAETRSD